MIKRKRVSKQGVGLKIKRERKKDMPETTPLSIITHALRLLWLRSRERAAAVKREGNCCESCHRKGSKAKGREVAIEVHHRRDDIDWKGIAGYLRRNLLCEPDKLVVLCSACHAREHDKS